jgi:hypothetical protein
MLAQPTAVAIKVRPKRRNIRGYGPLAIEGNVPEYSIDCIAYAFV